MHGCQSIRGRDTAGEGQSVPPHGSAGLQGAGSANAMKGLPENTRGAQRKRVAPGLPRHVRCGLVLLRLGHLRLNVLNLLEDGHGSRQPEADTGASWKGGLGHNQGKCAWSSTQRAARQGGRRGSGGSGRPSFFEGHITLWTGCLRHGPVPATCTNEYVNTVYFFAHA